MRDGPPKNTLPNQLLPNQVQLVAKVSCCVLTVGQLSGLQKTLAALPTGLQLAAFEEKETTISCSGCVASRLSCNNRQHGCKKDFGCALEQNLPDVAAGVS